MADYDFLIRMTDGTGGRKKGDVVGRAKEVPHVGWGAAECLPNYGVVRIKNVNFSQVSAYTKRHVPTKYDSQGNVISSVRCHYRFNIDTMGSFTGDPPHKTYTLTNAAAKLIDRTQE